MSVSNAQQMCAHADGRKDEGETVLERIKRRRDPDTAHSGPAENLSMVPSALALPRVLTDSSHTHAHTSQTSGTSLT